MPQSVRIVVFFLFFLEIVYIYFLKNKKIKYKLKNERYIQFKQNMC